MLGALRTYRETKSEFKILAGNPKGGLTGGERRFDEKLITMWVLQKNYYMLLNLQTIYAAPATIKTYLTVFNLHGYWTPHLLLGRPTFLLPAPPPPYTKLVMFVSFIRSNP
jgi:hypothetical protein